MADLKNSRDQSRLEKAAREDGSAWVHYEAEAEAVRKKTARLRALRLAKEAADKSAAVEKSAVTKKAAIRRTRPVKSTGDSVPPAASLTNQAKGGQRDSYDSAALESRARFVVYFVSITKSYGLQA